MQECSTKKCKKIVKFVRIVGGLCFVAARKIVIARFGNTKSKQSKQLGKISPKILYNFKHNY